MPKLPYDIDGWNIQLAVHDVSGWMHQSKNKAVHSTLLDNFDTIVYVATEPIFVIKNFAKWAILYLKIKLKN